jgi:hypothetical protein
MDDLMQKLNSSPKRTAQMAKQGANICPKGCQLPQSPTLEALHTAKGPSERLSVDHPMGNLLRPSHRGLRKVLSVDKVSLRMNASRLGRHGKKHNAGLLAQPAAVLSKKSTGYSTQSEEEVLREENERFRELCAVEEGRLQRLEKAIENENKVQLIRRQLYEESIKKLKRMAGVELFPSEGSEHNPDSIEESCEECDCLSVTSR